MHACMIYPPGDSCSVILKIATLESVFIQVGLEAILIRAIVDKRDLERDSHIAVALTWRLRCRFHVIC